MDINKLTQKSQEALTEAQSIATRMGHIEVDGEHLLMALIDQPEGLVPRLLDLIANPPAPGRHHLVDTANDASRAVC